VLNSNEVRLGPCSEDSRVFSVRLAYSLRLWKADGTSGAWTNSKYVEIGGGTYYPTVLFPKSKKLLADDPVWTSFSGGRRSFMCEIRMYLHSVFVEPKEGPVPELNVRNLAKTLLWDFLYAKARNGLSAPFKDSNSVTLDSGMNAARLTSPRPRRQTCAITFRRLLDCTKELVASV